MSLLLYLYLISLHRFCYCSFDIWLSVKFIWGGMFEDSNLLTSQFILYLHIYSEARNVIFVNRIMQIHRHACL